jgi:hypothetical protein
MTLSNMLTCSPAQQAPNSPSKLSAPPTRSGAIPGRARSRIRGQLPPPAQQLRALLAQPRGAAGIWGFSPDAPRIWDSVPDAPAGPDTAAIWQSLPDAPPDGWIAWRVHTHPTNSPRGHPPEGSWHGLALPSTSRAPPRTAYLPDCQPANGPAAARVRQCQARPTRPTRPSRPARSRRSRNQESRRRPFGVGNGRRGRAFGRRADPSSTTALLRERTPSGAAGLPGWLDTTCHCARRTKTLGVSSTWSYRGRAATKQLTAPEVGVGDPSPAPGPSHLPACHLLGK